MTADGVGAIIDSFNLPEWFVAEYSVRATGSSGAVATASFTDGNVDFALATVDQDAPANLSWTVNWSHHKDSPSCGAPATTGSTTYLGNSPTVGGSVAVGNGQSTKPTSVSATGYTLAYWSSSATSTTALTAAQLCKPGPGSATLYAHFDSATQPTTLTVGNASGTYGGTATLSATLTSGTSGIGGKTVASNSTARRLGLRPRTAPAWHRSLMRASRELAQVASPLEWRLRSPPNQDSREARPQACSPSLRRISRSRLRRRVA